jgi:hypothetical protein
MSGIIQTRFRLLGEKADMIFLFWAVIVIDLGELSSQTVQFYGIRSGVFPFYFRGFEMSCADVKNSAYLHQSGVRRDTEMLLFHHCD